jgi:hypothetical protein
VQRLLLLGRKARFFGALAAIALLAVAALGCGTTEACANGERGCVDANDDNGNAKDADGTANSDGNSGDGSSGVTWTTPTFELGTNLEAKAVPSAFVALKDGAPLAVTKGPQGLWMVVLAFRTCGLYVPPLVLRARVETDDKAAFGKVDIGKQKLQPGPDGLSYYYNFWLVVENPAEAGGKNADVTLTIEDAAGHTGTHKLRAALTGGVTIEP